MTATSNIPPHLQRYVDYINNTGRRPLSRAMFDEDWEPVGPKLRTDMVSSGLITDLPEGIYLRTDLLSAEVLATLPIPASQAVADETTKITLSDFINRVLVENNKHFENEWAKNHRENPAHYPTELTESEWWEQYIASEF